MDSYSLFGGSVFGSFGEGEDGQPAPDPALKSERAWSPAGGAATGPKGAPAPKDGRPASPVFSSESAEVSADETAPAPAGAPPATETDDVQLLKQQVAQLQAEKAQLAALAAAKQASTNGTARAAQLDVRLTLAPALARALSALATTAFHPDARICLVAWCVWFLESVCL
jgi:hypothetical protein